MSDAQKRLQELVESLEASMNSLGGSAYPLIDAKVSEDEEKEWGGLILGSGRHTHRRRSHMMPIDRLRQA
jgi:hypothetical protein